MKQIVYRQATPEDWPAISKLHVEHQQAQGTNFELPWLFGPSIYLALAAIDEDGTVIGCLYCEAVAELRFVGRDPKVTAAAMREVNSIAYLLKAKGFRWWEVFVPRKLSKAIGKPLRRAGFACVDKELSHFTRDLRSK